MLSCKYYNETARIEKAYTVPSSVFTGIGFLHVLYPGKRKVNTEELYACKTERQVCFKRDSFHHELESQKLFSFFFVQAGCHPQVQLKHIV